MAESGRDGRLNEETIDMVDGFARAADRYIWGTTHGGKPFAPNLRETDVYRKIDGKWMIVHVHASAPVDLKTDRGDLVAK